MKSFWARSLGQAELQEECQANGRGRPLDEKQAGVLHKPAQLYTYRESPIEV